MFSVTLIGAGGIGAVAALTLAKMGVRHISVYDDDTVDPVNLATQLHKVSDVGKPKVQAVCSLLTEFSDDVLPFGFDERVNGLSKLQGNLIISAVDSITARQTIWDALFNEGSLWDWFLDCRMSAEQYQHFLVCNEDLQKVRYWDMLSQLTEDSVPDVACTEKATFHCALMAAGHIGSVVRDIVRGEARCHRLVHVIPTHWLQTFSL